jgi:DNA-binding beta-propeller fold protein YncE
MRAPRYAQFALGFAAVVGLTLFRQTPISAQNPTPRFVGPLSSQPLALTSDDEFLAMVNPDNDTVSFFEVRNNRNRRVAQVPVQDEPNGVAFSPDSRWAYVANTVSGTVTVIPLNLANGLIQRPSYHIKVGTEPYSLLLAPNGT